MKVCFLSSMHPPFDKRVFDKEAVSLVRAGHEVVHLCPGDSGGAASHGVHIVNFSPPNGLRGRLSGLVNLYRLAKQIDADVYHCNEVDSWFVGVCLKVFRRKMCVFDVHEHYPSVFTEKRVPVMFRSLVSGLIRMLFRVLTPFTDYIVLAKNTVSDDFSCASGKKVLVRNYARLSALRFSQGRQDDVLSDELALVHLGLFGKDRGWPQVLEAMASIADVRVSLHVIGEFNDRTADEFDARVRLLGLAGRVRRTDWLPFDEAFDCLLQADVGVIAFQPGIQNHVYAMPHKMFDYMAAGLAVLCPDFAVEVAPVVVGSRCGLLIDPSSPSDIAAKIRQMASEPEVVKEMGRRGRDAVRECYNWETEAEKLIGMYKNLELRA